MARPDKQQRRKDTIKKLKGWQTSQAKAYRTYVRTSAVGLEFGLSIAIGALLGYFADKYFATSPYGLLLGVLIGSIAAAKRLWEFSKKYLKNDDNDDDR